MLRILSIISLTTLCTLAIDASGRYNEISVFFPGKLDIKKYQHGKSLIDNFTKYADKKVLFSKKDQIALKEVHSYLIKRKKTKIPLPSLMGKLNKNEYIDLIYYLKTRYRIGKL